MSHPNCNHAKLEQIIFFEPYSKIGTWQSSSPYFPWAEPESSLLKSSHLSPTPNQFVAFILQNSGGAEAFISLDFTFYMETWQLRFLALSPKKRNFSACHGKKLVIMALKKYLKLFTGLIVPLLLDEIISPYARTSVLSQVLVFLVTSRMFFSFFRTVGLLFLALLLFLIVVVFVYFFFLFLTTKQCFG